MRTSKYCYIITLRRRKKDALMSHRSAAAGINNSIATALHRNVSGLDAAAAATNASVHLLPRLSKRGYRVFHF